MRPLNLKLRGFRSYAGEHQFDFKGRSLLGVVGPIGSGKSSLLDAIAFALYGETPSITRNTRSLINQRSESAHVELLFEADGQVWRAVRALRDKGQGAHRLERVGGDEIVEEADGAKETTARVVGLLGLDYAAFGRSVLLAQNQFARFLQAKPGERDEVLKGVFGLERVDAMHQAAKERLAAAIRDLEELDRRRKEVEDDRRALAEVKADLQTANNRLAELIASSDRVRQVDEAIAASTEMDKQAGRRIAVLEGLASRLPSRQATDQMLGMAEAQAAELAQAQTARESARTKVDGADKAMTTVVREFGDRKALAATEALAVEAARAKQSLVELGRRHDRARRETSAAREALEQRIDAARGAQREFEVAERLRGEAETRLATAHEALHQAEHESMASTLREGLVRKEPCPVCTRPVDDLPAAGITADVVQAKREVRAADQAVRVTSRRLKEASALAADSGAKAAEARATTNRAAALQGELGESLSRAREAAEETADKLRNRIGDSEPDALIGRWVGLLEAAETTQVQATDLLRRANEQLDRARLERDRYKTNLVALAAEVAGLAGGLDLKLNPIAEPAPLSEAVAQLREVWEAAAADAETQRKEAARLLEDAESARGELMRGLGLASHADWGQAKAEAGERAASLRSKAEFLEERVGRLQELEQASATSTAHRAVYQRLVGDLVPSKFLSFLLDEERAELSAVAGERFELLTGGRYRFSDDGQFDVVDLAAAESVRASKSLSGGETFLASLALALALAEIVVRQGGRLDSFFLDEGFGSLDQEHLDLAVDGIERLVAAAPNRLVIVVSHVPELRHRFEDLIELDKDPMTGDTKVIRA